MPPPLPARRPQTLPQQHGVRRRDYRTHTLLGNTPKTTSSTLPVGTFVQAVKAVVHVCTRISQDRSDLHCSHFQDLLYRCPFLHVGTRSSHAGPATRVISILPNHPALLSPPVCRDPCTSETTAAQRRCPPTKTSRFDNRLRRIVAGLPARLLAGRELASGGPDRRRLWHRSNATETLCPTVRTVPRNPAARLSCDRSTEPITAEVLGDPNAACPNPTVPEARRIRHAGL